MWADACELLRRVERMQRHFAAPGPSELYHPSWEPPVDVFESGRELRVCVALPGVPPEAVDIELAGGLLTVRAHRRLGIRAHAGRVRQLEIPHGRFERRIALPCGRYELEGIEAYHGCLELKLGRT